MTTGKQAAWGETGRLAGRVRIGGSPGALGKCAKAMQAGSS